MKIHRNIHILIDPFCHSFVRVESVQSYIVTVRNAEKVKVVSSYNIVMKIEENQHGQDAMGRQRQENEVELNPSRGRWSSREHVGESLFAFGRMSSCPLKSHQGYHQWPGPRRSTLFFH